MKYNLLSRLNFIFAALFSVIASTEAHISASMLETPSTAQLELNTQTPQTTHPSDSKMNPGSEDLSPQDEFRNYLPRESPLVNRSPAFPKE